MTPEQIDQLIRLFSNLGNGAWEIALKQVNINNVVGIYWSIISILFVLISIPVMKKIYTSYYDKYEDFWNENNGRAYIIIIIITINIILLLFLFAGLKDIIGGISNPEFAAIEVLKKLVTK